MISVAYHSNIIYIHLICPCMSVLYCQDRRSTPCFIPSLLSHLQAIHQMTDASCSQWDFRSFLWGVNFEIIEVYVVSCIFPLCIGLLFLLFYLHEVKHNKVIQDCDELNALVTLRLGYTEVTKWPFVWWVPEYIKYVVCTSSVVVITFYILGI